jgi:glycosyltransferase involved in cell wall biosynthesis/SAM-dependent methyltransferase
MRFSVVLNSYNGELWIAEAIESVLAQSFGDWELIVWDDGSSDRTVAIARGFDDPRIRVIASDERLGIGGARDRAIAVARGEWLAFLDQDDLWLPGKLGAQNALIEADSEGRLGLVYGRTRRFSADGWKGAFDAWHGRGALPEGDIHAELVRKPSFIALSSACVRKAAVIELGGIPGYVRYCPDYYLFLALTRNWATACVQDVICLYRVHDTSMSSVFAGPIHEEALQIAETLASEDARALLPRRRNVRDVLIASAALRGGRVGEATGQLRSGGALAGFAAYPVVRGIRRWRRRDTGAIKYRLINAMRSAGLLLPLDHARFAQRRLQTWRRNRRFRDEHPGFVVPPAGLAFDAFNMVDWRTYLNGGRCHAEVFAEAILKHSDVDKIAVLEWGCGPGRIIRHMQELLGDRAGALTGCDYNPETIAWCRDNLPSIAFEENRLMPPLPFADDSFDAIYNFSVFTHLSQAAGQAWAAELMRVLRPGGTLLSTTHGDNYLYLLTRADELRRYARGSVVTQAEYAEGRKWFFAVHPPAFVRQRLFGGLASVEKLPVAADAGMLQDLWLARKAPALVPA